MAKRPDAAAVLAFCATSFTWWISMMGEKNFKLMLIAAVLLAIATAWFWWLMIPNCIAKAIAITLQVIVIGIWVYGPIINQQHLDKRPPPETIEARKLRIRNTASDLESIGWKLEAGARMGHWRGNDEFGVELRKWNKDLVSKMGAFEKWYENRLGHPEIEILTDDYYEKSKSSGDGSSMYNNIRKKIRVLREISIENQ